MDTSILMSKEKIPDEENTKVGKVLSDTMVKKTIILSFILIIIMPLFSSDYYVDDNYFMVY